MHVWNDEATKTPKQQQQQYIHTYEQAKEIGHIDLNKSH